MLTSSLPEILWFVRSSNKIYQILLAHFFAEVHEVVASPALGIIFFMSKKLTIVWEQLK